MGRASAFRMAEAGANIAIVDLNKEAGQKVCEELLAKYSNQKFTVSTVFRLTKLRHLGSRVVYCLTCTVPGCRRYRRQGS
jgi:NAD(P)-dependent dehydrogenase (short-subunit alcohol dehydrogenase family)